MSIENPLDQQASKRKIKLMNLQGINGRPDLKNDVTEYMKQHGIANFETPYASKVDEEDRLMAEWIARHSEASVDMNSEAIGAVRGRVDQLNFAMRDGELEKARYEIGLIKQLLDKIEMGLGVIEEESKSPKK